MVHSGNSHYLGFRAWLQAVLQTPDFSLLPNRISSAMLGRVIAVQSIGREPGLFINLRHLAACFPPKKFADCLI
jgi:hypothetical protein